MTEALDSFEVDGAVDSVESAAENEGTNAVRLAMMASVVPEVCDGVPDLLLPPDDLSAVGFDPGVMFEIVGAEPERQAAREAMYLAKNLRGRVESTTLRYQSFFALRDGRSEARLAFLAAGLCSRLERESIVAASAIITSVPRQDAGHLGSRWRLWRRRLLERNFSPVVGERRGGLAAQGGGIAASEDWHGAEWQDYCSFWLCELLDRTTCKEVLEGVRIIALERLELGKTSLDAIVREISLAPAFGSKGETVERVTGPNATALKPAAHAVATVVHGAREFGEEWWYPGGDFHSYISTETCLELYAGGQEFTWSGTFNDRDRAMGGARFARWIDAAGGAQGGRRVFAHSHGGEVVARAVNSGSVIDEVVLLSAPVNAHHLAFVDLVPRIIDIRLRFDVTLLAARVKQHLPSHDAVTRYELRSNYWSHGASHSSRVWRLEGIAAAVGL